MCHFGALHGYGYEFTLLFCFVEEKHFGFVYWDLFIEFYAQQVMLHDMHIL